MKVLRASVRRGFLKFVTLRGANPCNGLKDSVLRSALSVVLRVLRCPKVHDRDTILPLQR